MLALLASTLLGGCAGQSAKAATPSSPTATAPSTTAPAPATTPTKPAPKLDVIWVPSPPEVIKAMLDAAKVGPNDVVYDLGCGDGRIPITAAKQYGARAVGIDIDPRRIDESRANAKAAGVEHLVEFRLEDALQADVSRATVVTLYLLGSANALLRPVLTKQLRPGARIVSHAFSMGPTWPADKIDQFTTSRGDEITLYLWKADGKVRQ